MTGCLSGITRENPTAPFEFADDRMISERFLRAIERHAGAGGWAEHKKCVDALRKDYNREQINAIIEQGQRLIASSMRSTAREGNSMTSARNSQEARVERFVRLTQDIGLAVYGFELARGARHPASASSRSR